MTYTIEVPNSNGRANEMHGGIEYEVFNAATVAYTATVSPSVSYGIKCVNTAQLRLAIAVGGPEWALLVSADLISLGVPVGSPFNLEVYRHPLVSSTYTYSVWINGNKRPEVSYGNIGNGHHLRITATGREVYIRNGSLEPEPLGNWSVLTLPVIEKRKPEATLPVTTEEFVAGFSTIEPGKVLYGVDVSGIGQADSIKCVSVGHATRTNRRSPRNALTTIAGLIGTAKQPPVNLTTLNVGVLTTTRNVFHSNDNAGEAWTKTTLAAADIGLDITIADE